MVALPVQIDDREGSRGHNQSGRARNVQSLVAGLQQQERHARQWGGFRAQIFEEDFCELRRRRMSQ